MAQVLAFDVYGTLIDTHGVVTELERRLGALGKAELAPEFSRRWRDKQLEYSFRRGLMGAYAPFGRCTEEALVFTDRALQAGLSENDRDHLMQVYAELPAFAEAEVALTRLAEAGVICVAFSNGTAAAVEGAARAGRPAPPLQRGGQRRRGQALQAGSRGLRSPAPSPRERTRRYLADLQQRLRRHRRALCRPPCRLGAAQPGGALRPLGHRTRPHRHRPRGPG